MTQSRKFLTNTILQRTMYAYKKGTENNRHERNKQENQEGTTRLHLTTGFYRILKMDLNLHYPKLF